MTAANSFVSSLQNGEIYFFGRAKKVSFEFAYKVVAFTRYQYGCVIDE